MNRDISRIIENIEYNINRCDILSRLLEEKSCGGLVNYDGYYANGYENDEIYLGAQLIDLYIMLKKYIEQIEGYNNT